MTRRVLAVLALAGLLTGSPALAADGAKIFQLQCKPCLLYTSDAADE